MIHLLVTIRAAKLVVRAPTLDMVFAMDSNRTFWTEPHVVVVVNVKMHEFIFRCNRQANKLTFVTGSMQRKHRRRRGEKLDRRQQATSAGDWHLNWRLACPLHPCLYYLLLPQKTWSESPQGCIDTSAGWLARMEL